MAEERSGSAMARPHGSHRGRATCGHTVHGTMMVGSNGGHEGGSAADAARGMQHLMCDDHERAAADENERPRERNHSGPVRSCEAGESGGRPSTDQLMQVPSGELQSSLVGNSSR